MAGRTVRAGGRRAMLGTAVLLLLAGCTVPVSGSAQTVAGGAATGSKPTAVRPLEPSTPDGSTTPDPGAGGDSSTVPDPGSGGEPSSDPGTEPSAPPVASEPPASGGQGTGDGTAGSSGGNTLPAWLTPGLRLTYQVLGANLAMSSVWVADPNGTWVDRATGQHYSERSVGNPNGGQNGAAGSGLNQYDILGLNGNAVAYTKTDYLLDQGAFQATAITANEETDGNLLEVYLSPAAIQSMIQHPEPGYLFVYGPFQLGQQTFQAVAAIRTSASNPGSEIIDTKTGLLLQVFTSVNTTDAGGSPASQVSFLQLDAVRQLVLPGLSGHNPRWVGQSGKLSYTGTNTYADAVNRQTTAVTESVAYQSLFGQLTQATPTVNGKAGQPQLAGPAGPYWIDPAALAELRSGQQLDSDPVTGAKVSVQSADRSAVVIDSTDGGVQTTSTYDTSSGVLRQLQSQNQSNTLSLQLQSQ